jgi:NitT/TauT family transport system ATP-binding protein
VDKTKDADKTGRLRMDLHQITKVSFSQVLALARAVDEHGGVADVARIADDVEMDLDEIGPVVAAAEFLGVLTVDEGDLRLTDFGRKLMKASVRERKAMLREFMKDLPVFRYVIQLIESSGRPATRQEVTEALAVHFGSHQMEDLFRALVYWGRASELIAYDSRSELLTLRKPGVPMPPAH